MHDDLLGNYPSTIQGGVGRDGCCHRVVAGERGEGQGTQQGAHEWSDGIANFVELAQASNTLSHEQINARIVSLAEEIQRKQDRLSKAGTNVASEEDIRNKEMYKKKRALYSKLCSERKNAVPPLTPNNM